MIVIFEVVEFLSIGIVLVFNLDVFNNEGIQECLVKGEVFEKVVEVFEKKNSISCFFVYENGSLFLESRYWMYLFEEEFLRRFLRLQFIFSFGK